MKTRLLEPEEVLAGYERVCSLYEHIPSLSHWRAWEYAAYQAYRIEGRILDLGCGDGRYFRLLWPHADQVIGVDMNSAVAALGRASGVYREVHEVPAHRIPEADCSFDSIFANCSLEHMDSLDEVLAEAYRCLKPGGGLLCSVVTERFLEWSVLPRLIEAAGYRDAGEVVRSDFLDFHHLVNPLTVEQWLARFERAGFVAEEHVPLLPLYNTGIFCLADHIWHLKRDGGGEFGDFIFPFLSENPRFALGFRHIVAGLLEMEMTPDVGSGAVFRLKKPGA